MDVYIPVYSVQQFANAEFMVGSTMLMALTAVECDMWVMR